MIVWWIQQQINNIISLFFFYLQNFKNFGPNQLKKEEKKIREKQTFKEKIKNGVFKVAKKSQDACISWSKNTLSAEHYFELLI